MIKNGSGNEEANNYMSKEVLSTAGNDKNDMDIRLYPNPGREHVNLEIHNEDIQEFTYTVFDITGKQISNEQVNKNHTIISLSKGVYILKIKTKNQWHTRKLIMY
jgi:predicted metalloenzyme YecM